MFARKGKRSLALLLTVVMVLSLLPFSALATSSASQIEQNGSGSYLYHTLDSNGTSTGSDTTAAITSAGGKVEISKIISSTSQENLFDITLTVKTKQATNTIVTSPDAAAVLVLDTSSSMNGSKLTAAKAAAINFAKTFAADANGAERWISVVQFSRGSARVLNWTDAAALTWASTPNNAITQAINGLTVGDYTDPEAGLQVAYNLFHNSTMSASVSGVSTSNKFVILLTDGSPNAYLKDSGPGAVSNATRNSATGFDSSQTNTDYHMNYGSTTAASKAGAVAANITGTGTDQLSAKLYSVCYGASNDYIGSGSGRYTVLTWLGNISSAVYTAADSDSIDQTFDSIITQIELIAQAGIVTDPMGQYIVFDSAYNSASNNVTTDNGTSLRNYNSSSRILTWNTNGDTPVHSGDWYIYTLNYRVSLNTAASGFQENTYYLTNGVTTLSYAFYDGTGRLMDEAGNYIYNTDGSINTSSDQCTTLRTLGFKVPAVKGEIPTVPYTIQYYKKDKTTGTYPATPNATKPGTAKLWTTVSVATVDSGYETKYDGDNYDFAGGDLTKQLTSTTANTLKLYYDPISAKVISYHYLITKTISDEHPDGEYSAPQLIGTVDSQTDEGKTLYKGDSYTADLLSYDPYTGSDYVSDSATISSLAAGTNTLTFYYVTETGSRTAVNYEAHYFYRTNPWVLNSSNKYVLTDGTYSEDTAAKVTGSGWHNDPFTAPDKPNDYSLDYVDSSSGTRTITLNKNGNNIINVYYEKDATAPDTATLTITHNYYVQTISGTSLADSYNELEDQTVYVGETYNATVNTGYADETWTCTSGTTSIVIDSGTNTLTINYYRDARVPVDVYVQYNFFTWKWIINGEGGAELVIDDSATFSEGPTKLSGTYYKDGSATASDQTSHSDFIADADNVYALSPLEATGNLITLNYNKLPSDLEEGSATVIHVYNYYRSYVDSDGTVHLNEYQETKTDTKDTVYGDVGEWFIASAQTSFDGYDDWTQISPATVNDTTMKVVLTTSGTEFRITYERLQNDLPETATYSIQPVFVDLTTQVNSTTGNIETVISHVTSTEATTPSGTFYVGQKVSVNPDDYDKTDYALVAASGDIYDILSGAGYNNSTYTDVILGNEPTVITLYYVKVTSNLVPASVVIRNHYTFVTYTSPGGVYTVTTDPNNEIVSDNAITGYYAGQFFTTTDKGTGRTNYSLAAPEPDATVQLDEGTNYVDFYYYGTSDQTVPATIQVIHDYTITDWDGTTSHYIVNGEGTETPNIFSGYYAGGSFTATPNYQTPVFSWNNITDVTGATVTPPAEGSDEGEIVCDPLSEGLNVITIYYAKTVDTREATEVRVYHEYTTHDTYTGNDITQETSETFTSFSDNVWVGHSFIAEPITYYNEKNFTVQSAVPENYTIDELAAVTEETPHPNDITINYYREYDSRDGSDYSFTVRYVNGSTGEQIGDVVTGQATYDTTLNESLVGEILENEGWINARRPSGFNSGSVSGYITISADASQNVITVTYNYSGGGDDTPVYYNVHYTFSGNHPDVTLPADDTYTRNTLVQVADGYDDVTTADGVWHFNGWSRTGEFRITGNTTITGTWTFTPDETTIDEEEPPLGGTPSTEPPEEPPVVIEEPEVPLGNLPQTGTSAAPVNPVWTLGMLALSLSMAAAGLTVTFGRKKDEEQK